MEKIIYLENWTSYEQKITVSDKVLNMFFAQFKDENGNFVYTFNYNNKELELHSEEETNKVVGNAIWMMVILGVTYCVLGLIFLKPLLNAFGATEANFPYAYSYASITLLGVPFLITNNALSNLIRADGSPKYSMISMVTGAIINTILDPIFIFGLNMGMHGAGLATAFGQFVSFIVLFILFKNL